MRMNREFSSLHDLFQREESLFMLSMGKDHYRFERKEMIGRREKGEGELGIITDR